MAANDDPKAPLIAETVQIMLTLQRTTDGAEALDYHIAAASPLGRELPSGTLLLGMLTQALLDVYWAGKVQEAQEEAPEEPPQRRRPRRKKQPPQEQ